MQLWNILSKEDLEKKWREKDYEWVTISFYQYAKIDNPQVFRDYLYSIWQKIDVLGRVYVATEGINAQITVPQQNFEQFRKELYEISFLDGVRLNLAVENGDTEFSFLKSKSTSGDFSLV